MTHYEVVICEAEFPKDAEKVATLFNAYAKSLEIDLAFQNFNDELSSLPGKYANSKGGAVFLAYKSPPTEADQPVVIGCAALRAFNAPQECEIKRLYITPESRRLGAGRKLLERIIARAKELGYEEMLLDTLSSMTAARRMCADYGFEECENYYNSPLEGTVIMRLKLQ